MAVWWCGDLVAWWFGDGCVCLLLLVLDTNTKWPLNLKLSDTKGYKPETRARFRTTATRARLGTSAARARLRTTAHFCKVVEPASVMAGREDPGGDLPRIRPSPRQGTTPSLLDKVLPLSHCHPRCPPPFHCIPLSFHFGTQQNLCWISRLPMLKTRADLLF